MNQDYDTTAPSKRSPKSESTEKNVGKSQPPGSDSPPAAFPTLFELPDLSVGRDSTDQEPHFIAAHASHDGPPASHLDMPPGGSGRRNRFDPNDPVPLSGHEKEWSGGSQKGHWDNTNSADAQRRSDGPSDRVAASNSDPEEASRGSRGAIVLVTLMMLTLAFAAGRAMHSRVDLPSQPSLAEHEPANNSELAERNAIVENSIVKSDESLLANDAVVADRLDSELTETEFGDVAVSLANEDESWLNIEGEGIASSVPQYAQSEMTLADPEHDPATPESPAPDETFSETAMQDLDVFQAVEAELGRDDISQDELLDAFGDFEGTKDLLGEFDQEPSVTPQTVQQSTNQQVVGEPDLGEPQLPAASTSPDGQSILLNPPTETGLEMHGGQGGFVSTELSGSSVDFPTHMMDKVRYSTTPNGFSDLLGFAESLGVWDASPEIQSESNLDSLSNTTQSQP